MRVLFVSKPIAPPFNDGSKCLVHSLCLGLSSHSAQVMGIRGAEFKLPNTEVLPTYGAGGGFAPSLAQNALALKFLMRERQADIWHFVFAPNQRASAALSLLRRVRKTPAVQTIASPPKSFEHIERLLFGDVVVAQSDWTKQQILTALSVPCDVHVIHPPLGDVAEPSADDERDVRQRLQIAADAPVVVYPGDLEFSNGAQRFARMAQGVADSNPSIFVFACRRKTELAAGVEAELRARLDPARVRFAGELPSLLPLVKTACCVVFPVEDLWGKVDIPISLLEAAQLSTPLLVAENGPPSEIEGAVRLPLDDTFAWLQGIARFTSLSEDYSAVASQQLAGLDRTHRPGQVSARYERLYEQLRG